MADKSKKATTKAATPYKHHDHEEDDSDDLPLLDHEDIQLGAEPSETKKDERDPFEYCEHIQGEVKRLKQKIAQKKVAEELTQEQMDEERQVRRRQLEAIFSLMAEKDDNKFGVNTMDEVQSQLKLYL